MGERSPTEGEEKGGQKRGGIGNTMGLGSSKRNPCWKGIKENSWSRNGRQYLPRGKKERIKKKRG